MGKSRKYAALCALLLALLMLLPNMVSCGEKREGICVVATLFPQYDFARSVMGDTGNLDMIISPGEESHSFEPSVTDIALIRNADLFIYVGGETDGWAKDALATVGNPDMKVICLLDICDALTEEQVDGMETEHEEHEEHGEHSAEEPEYDEHVWTSPYNAKKITEAIRDALCDLDPGHADAYRANCAGYTAELDALDAELAATVASAKRRLIIFAERFPFRYLCERYGLEYYAAFPGCSSQSEPSLATLSFLVGKVKENGVPVVLQIEFSNGTVASWIASETGAKVMELHSCHNITKDDFAAGVTYLSLMRKNAEVLREALN